MRDQPTSIPFEARAPLPALDRVLATDAARVAAARFGRTATLASVRASLEGELGLATAAAGGAA